MGRIVKSLKSDPAKAFTKILKAEVIENAENIRFSLGGIFQQIEGVGIVQQQVSYASEIDGKFIDKKDSFSVSSGQQIKVFVTDIDSIGVFDASGIFVDCPFLFDLAEFINIPIVYTFRLFGATFRNMQLLSEKVNPKEFLFLMLTNTKFFDPIENTEINQDLSFLDDFENLSSINLTGSNILGKMRLDNKPNLRSLNISKGLLVTEDLDDVVQKLYSEGSFFTQSGKSLDIREQRTGDTLSGVLGDPVSSGTGQGYATGLTDDFEWIVRQ